MTSFTPQPTYLGSIYRPIAGSIHANNQLKENDELLLVREHVSGVDPNAIRIESTSGDRVGHIPRKDAAWLAPLLDSQRIAVEAVATLIQSTRKLTRPYVIIEVTLMDQSILEEQRLEGIHRINHQVVLQAYNNLDGYPDAESILQMRDQLRRTLYPRLPETDLLLALFRHHAEDMRDRFSTKSISGLNSAFESLSIGDEIPINGISIVPVYNRKLPGDRILHLQEAMNENLIVVQEVSESGDVGQLLVENKSQNNVLLPEGDVLLGAKQNRIINVSILIRARSSLVIPVSCVERGRWSSTQRIHFQARDIAPPKVRKKNMEFMKKSLDMNKGYSGDQGGVWNEVSECLTEANASSSTESLSDAKARLRESLEEKRRQMIYPTDACGIFMLHNKFPVALDIFPHPEMLEAAWDNLIESYMSEVMVHKKKDAPMVKKNASAILTMLKTNLAPSKETIGLGQRFEYEDATTHSSCLMHGEDMCHVSAFF